MRGCGSLWKGSAMSAEQSWGEETVAFGRGATQGHGSSPPRAPGPRLPRPSSRTLVLAALVVVLVAALEAGSDSGTAPIRKGTDQVPRAAPMRPRPPRPRRLSATKPPARPKRAGKLKGKRETHPATEAPPEPSALAPPQPAAAPMPATAPEAAPTPESEPGPKASPAPTPAAAEFGM
jgi:hypothetical protein